MEGDSKCLLSSSLEVTLDLETKNEALNYSEIGSDKAGLEKVRRINYK